MKNIHGLLLIGCSAFALASCGPNELASPGTGGNVTINNPGTPAPTPTPTPGGGTVVAAANCPTTFAAGLTNEGTISGPTGSYRVCELPAVIDVSSTLPYSEGVIYRLNGRVDVGVDGGPAPDNSDGATDTNVTLTIEPGVIVYASGADFLNVTRGNEINAVGTKARPIVFTSRQNVLGENDDLDSGQWGGVILSGRAQVTDCLTGGAPEGTVQCERRVEGAATPVLFGGATNDDSSGRMSYVQIRYSGFSLSEGNELQSLTTGGTGSKTRLDHIMSFNSSDDGVEFFGGYVNVKHLIVVGAEDNSLDLDTGVKANMQYVVVVQNANAHDGLIEGNSGSNRNAVPRQDTVISNFTFVNPSTASAGANASLYLRGGADFALLNGIIISPNDECVRVQHAETVQATGSDENGPVVFQSVVMQCASTAFIDSDIPAGTVQGLFTSGSNNNASFTPTLTSVFINGANENAVQPFNPSAYSTADFTFDVTNYIGAVRNAADDWYTGWTCNSGTVNFGSNVGNCTSLPVYN